MLPCYPGFSASAYLECTNTRPNSANLFGHWKALGNHCLLAAIIFIRRIPVVLFTQMFFSELGGPGQCRVGDDEVEVLWWRPDENVVPLLVTW